jgi:hypothetical protein
MDDVDVYTPEQFLSLPAELQQSIALDLDYQSLMNLCTGAKGLKQTICEDEGFWKAKYMRDFTNDPHKTTYQELYKQKIRMSMYAYIEIVEIDIESEAPYVNFNIVSYSYNSPLKKTFVNLYLPLEAIESMIDVSLDDGFEEWFGDRYRDVRAYFMDPVTMAISFKNNDFQEYHTRFWNVLMKLLRWARETYKEDIREGAEIAYTIRSDYSIKERIDTTERALDLSVFL